MVGLNASEIIGLLEMQEELTRPVDIVMMPPDESDISDEDSDNEEDRLPKDPNHLGHGSLSQAADLVLFDDADDELPQVMEVDETGKLTAVEDGETVGEKEKGTKRRKDRQYQLRSVKHRGQDHLEVVEDDERGEIDDEDEGGEEDEQGQAGEEAGDNAGSHHEEKLTRKRNKDRKWSISDAGMQSKVPDFTQPPFIPVPDDCNTPYDFFKLFVDDDFVDQLVSQSVAYANQRNLPGEAAKINHSTMRVSHAVMFVTGYSTPANRKMFWEQREDAMNLLVKKNITRDDFISVISFTHFADTPDPQDKFWKVRLLFNQLNDKAKLYVVQTENVSVDEGMIKYLGPHPLKQFVRGKPTRFGYKIWILATSRGQLLACQLYAGTATAIKAYGLGQGPDVVFGLAEQYGLLPGSKVNIRYHIIKL